MTQLTSVCYGCKSDIPVNAAFCPYCAKFAPDVPPPRPEDVLSTACACDGFAEHQREARDNHGNGEIVKGEDGWHINGCCGGGCYVVSDITHCPFCGSALA